MSQQSSLGSGGEINSIHRFSAWLSADAVDVTGDGSTYTLIANNELYDIGSNYDAATGIYTAAVQGVYVFTVRYSLGNLNANHDSGQVGFITPGPTSNIFGFIGNPGAIRNAVNQLGMLETTQMFLEIGDTIRVQIVVFSSTKTVKVNGGPIATTFSGYLAIGG